MQFIRNLYIKLKLYYYYFLDFVEEELRGSGSLPIDIQITERQQENVKLISGVRRLVKRLRGMSKEERLSTENLLCAEPYKKTRKEKMDELRVRDKLNRNPIIKTEDDLVAKVVKESPRYTLERELSEVRKAMTACLRAASADPSNPSHTATARSLKARESLLRGQIRRLKDGA